MAWEHLFIQQKSTGCSPRAACYLDARDATQLGLFIFLLCASPVGYTYAGYSARWEACSMPGVYSFFSSIPRPVGYTRAI